MTTPKRIDRKAFLGSTMAACAVVTFGSCSDDGDTGGTGGSSGAANGGTGGKAGASSGGSSGSTTGGKSGASAGGTSGGGTAGDGGEGGGGGTLVCTTETDNGDHSHEVTIPGSDVEEGYDATYVLEDGGTGHTHTLMISAYEFVYLQFDGFLTVTSSETENHTHECVITCVES